jgi:hypothetical protein
MNVRQATEADAEAIARVHLASMREAYQRLFPAGALAQLDAHGERNGGANTWHSPGP